MLTGAAYAALFFDASFLCRASCLYLLSSYEVGRLVVPFTLHHHVGFGSDTYVDVFRIGGLELQTIAASSEIVRLVRLLRMFKELALFWFRAVL